MWRDLNILEKNIIIFPIAICIRFRYITAFKFTQAALDSLAITYNGIDTNRETLNNRYSVADYRYELESSCIKKTNQWNSLVKHWLKICID